MTWRSHFSACLAETDPQTLETLLQETESAMLFRAKQLLKNGDAFKERAEIEDALFVLLGLKSVRLGWPHPFEGNTKREAPRDQQQSA
jgi:hypothetical protein